MQILDLKYYTFMQFTDFKFKYYIAMQYTDFKFKV